MRHTSGTGSSPRQCLTQQGVTQPNMLNQIKWNEFSCTLWFWFRLPPPAPRTRDYINFVVIQRIDTPNRSICIQHIAERSRPYAMSNRVLICVFNPPKMIARYCVTKWKKIEQIVQWTTIISLHLNIAYTFFPLHQILSFVENIGLLPVVPDHRIISSVFCTHLCFCRFVSSLFCDWFRCFFVKKIIFVHS